MSLQTIPMPKRLLRVPQERQAMQPQRMQKCEMQEYGPPHFGKEQNTPKIIQSSTPVSETFHQ